MNLITAFLLCLILTNSFGVMSQNRLADEPHVKGPFQCQNNEAFLGGIAHTTPTDSLLIVIARAGQKETLSKINKRRLHNVRTYLTRFGSEKRPNESIILAEGERVRDYGRLEFYVNGKLVAILNLKHNSDLIVGNCYPEPLDAPFCNVKENQMFYPCIDQSVRPKKH